MSEKFRNKFRIASARWQRWNYGWQAAYFITICTQNRICYFGDVVNGQMQLSEIGEIAKQEWLKTFNMRPDMNLHMGEWVIMPNHFHAIIVIGENEYNISQCTAETQCTVETQCIASLPPLRRKNQFGPQSKNLASVVRGFKIGVTKRARQIHANFAWQPRYHDHIIRNADAYNTIAKYIVNNPLRWDADKFHE